MTIGNNHHQAPEQLTDATCFAFQWNFKEYTEQCQKAWGVTPLEYWAEVQYGGKKLKDHSNIVFRFVADW